MLSTIVETLRSCLNLILCGRAKFYRAFLKAFDYINRRRGYVILFLSWAFVATAGYKARESETGIEHWFVFAAGLTNLLALFDLGPELLKDGNSKALRFWLWFEMIFFTVILGIDVKLAFGEYRTALLIVSAILLFLILLLAVLSENPGGKVGLIIAAALFTVSLVSIPPLMEFVPKFITSLIESFDSNCKNHLSFVVLERGYAWIHLLGIPSIYYVVDSQIAKIDSNWRKFLFLDRSLFLAGLACAVSGFIYALLGPDPHTSPPHYEAGAAALLLLLGNSWYLSIKAGHETENS